MVGEVVHGGAVGHLGEPCEYFEAGDVGVVGAAEGVVDRADGVGLNVEYGDHRFEAELRWGPRAPDVWQCATWPRAKLIRVKGAVR